MSLHNLANHMAGYGRNGDSMLMHVTPDEVQGLQRLAMAQGGSLTINPHTGLPEANIFSQAWKKIKPIAAPLAGLALNYFVPGLGTMMGGISNAAAAGLTVGGIGGLATGSLSKGLMAGLGAYGGANIGAGLSNIGADAASQAAAQGAYGSVMPSAANALPDVSALDAAKYAAQQGQAAAAAMSPFDKLSGGISSAISDPKSALTTLGGGSLMKGAGTLAATGLPVLSEIQAGQTAKMPTLGDASPQAMIRPIILNRRQNPTPYTGQGEARYFLDTYDVPEPYKAATGGVIAFNQGGLGTLGGYSDGGRLLRGPGDGVSDNIPAMIGDRQPARLADGEFVVPARIVSEIGNGSTEAGARKLYAMMDRVQRARGKTVGKHKVATDTNAERLLPA
jgi:hypothetical protein